MDMKNITEDYVSFETAKLLKAKGFDQSTSVCNTVYKPNGYISNNAKSFISPSYICKDIYVFAPTLQMAMKWLREVHNIFICIIPSEVGVGVMDYTYVLYKIDAKNFYFEDLGIQGRAKNISEISYEEACEAAIIYCLENLI